MNNRSNISCVIVDGVILSILSISELRPYRICKVKERKEKQKTTRTIDIKLWYTNTYIFMLQEKYKKDIPTMKFISSIRKHLAIEKDNLTIRIKKYSIYIDVTIIIKGNIQINNDYNYNSSFSDNIWAIKMTTFYPSIFTLLNGKYGYSWKQYYNSICRFNWLKEYFVNPNAYIDAIPTLLFFFSSIDEICLFDIVYKAHVKEYDDIGNTSKLKLRYKIKNNFIKNIISPKLNLFSLSHLNKTPSLEDRKYHFLFDSSFRYPIVCLSQLNWIVYIKLELRFDQEKLTINDYIYSNMLIEAIEEDNDTLVDYILSCVMNNNKIIDYYDMIQEAILKSNLDSKNSIYSRLEIIYENYRINAKINYSSIFYEEDINDDLPPIIFLDDDFY